MLSAGAPEPRHEQEEIEHDDGIREVVARGWRLRAVPCAVSPASSACRGDSVIMKNGIVYRSQGAPDRDNTLLYISDGLKRVVVRDSKVERIEANNAFRTGEKFQLVQPMTRPRRDPARRGHRRQGRPLERARAAVIRVHFADEQADPDGTGDHRDRSRTSPGFAVSTASGSVRSKSTRSRASR